MSKEFRKIVTRRGTYFVPWRPEDVSMLLENERLSPNELVLENKSRLHFLIRDLYLLACQASLDGGEGNNAVNHSRLVSYARYLHDIYRNK